MPRKRLPSDEEMPQIIKQQLYDLLMSANKPSNYVEVTCRHCGKRQKVRGEIA